MSVLSGGSPWVIIEVEGAPLDPIVSGSLQTVEVDLSLFVPSQFRLVFAGGRDEILLASGLQLAAQVNIQVADGPTPTPLMTMAEVTAVDIEYGPEGDLTIVRGMDASHRLMRGNKTMAYPDMTASDVVTALLGESTVTPGEIMPTDNTYEWLTQANLSSWAFIQQLAAMENYVAYVDPLGLFNFAPMPLPEEGPPPVMSGDEPSVGGVLVLGRDILRLRGTVSSAEQVPEVNVTGWDPAANIPVLGLAPGLPSTAQSLDPAVLPAVVAGEMEATPFFDASVPFISETAAETRALAIAADIAGAMAEIEGECLGNSGIIAGASISLGLAGNPFDGQYICSGARHLFDPNLGGYRTWFTVGGRRDRSLYALSSGKVPGRPRPEVPGVVIGMVLDVDDPESQGRVKVSFPWLSEAYISAWAPTVQMGAGPAGGCLWLPEVGDSVLMAFDRGDMNYPYVIGGVYNGMFNPDPPPEVEGLVAARRLTSRMLHNIQFNDGPELMGITIETGTQTLSITMNDEEMSIAVVAGAGGLTIDSAGDVSITAVGDLSLGGATVSMTGDTTVTVSGEASVAMTGGEVSISADAAVSISGDATVSVSAPMVSLGA